MPGKSVFLVHGSRDASIVAGKAEEQARILSVAAGGCLFTCLGIKKDRKVTAKCSAAFLLSPLYLVQDPAYGMVPIFRAGFLSLFLTGAAFIDIP